MVLHPLAEEANAAITEANPVLFELLSRLGRRLFFPARGILAQASEAKARATRCDATVGIATDGRQPLNLPVIARRFADDLPQADIFPYAPSGGRPGLRQAWADKIRRQTPSLGDVPISLPVVTNALTHGLSIIGDLFIDPGDQVLVPDLRWENYDLCWATRLQARLVEYPLFTRGLDGLDLDGLRRTLRRRAGRKAILVFNFPNNPSGYSPTRSEAADLIGIVREAGAAGTRLVVVCDDAYYGMNYEDDIQSESLFGALAGLDDSILAIKGDGATKEFFVWGLRVGFLTFGCRRSNPACYRALEHKTAGLIRGTVSNITMSGQAIVEAALTHPETPAQQVATVALLRERYQAVKAAARNPAYADRWSVYPFNSGYFMCLRLKGVGAESARQRLLDDHGIGLIALGEHDLRIAFSCVPVEKIPELFARIADTVGTLQR